MLEKMFGIAFGCNHIYGCNCTLHYRRWYGKLVAWCFHRLPKATFQKLIDKYVIE